jgi:desulfoferrodoxin (superoxide reductase-like protein)
MVATRFNQDLSLATKNRTAAAVAQKIANDKHQPVTMRRTNAGVDVLVGIIAGPNTLTFFPDAA